MKVKVSLISAYRNVIRALINCFFDGEFDARYLANEINSVPLPKATSSFEEEETNKYYNFLIKELNDREHKKVKKANNKFEPNKREVNAWWKSLNFGEQMEVIKQIYPDGNIGIERWQCLSWEAQLEIYEENALED